MDFDFFSDALRAALGCSQNLQSKNSVKNFSEKLKRAIEFETAFSQKKLRKSEFQTLHASMLKNSRKHTIIFIYLN